MTSFTALNIIPDSDSDSEVDNTQELQIEEALKIYQKAIKAHSESNWAEAHNAYQELFKSEIFEYAGDGVEEGTITPASSSIQSILYLAFKNHASFLLDRLKAQQPIDLSHPDTQRSFRLALYWFAKALARDSGDTSLWRNTAQISHVFNSSRLARFCLESVLQVDKEVTDSGQSVVLVQGGLRPEEFLATIKLRDLLTHLQDDASCSTAFFQSVKNKKTKATFALHLDPYPWLANKSIPVREYVEEVEAISYDPSKDPERHTLHVPMRTWPAIGMALLKRRNMVDETPVASEFSQYIKIDIPPGSDSPPSTPSTITPHETTPVSTEIAVIEDGDVQMAEAIQVIPEFHKDSSNRKRKSTSLGGVDDTGRSRLSKRVRDRENAQAAAAIPPPPPVRPLVSSDDKLFLTAESCFAPLGLSLGKASSLKIRVRGDENEAVESKDWYLRDFKNILRYWDDDKGNVVLYGEGIQDPKEEATPGAALLNMEATTSSNSYHPLLSEGDGIRRWLKSIDKGCLHVRDLSIEWLKVLLMREYHDPQSGSGKLQNDMLASDGKASWLKHSWPEPLRDLVVSTVNECEEILWSYFKDWEIEFKKKLDRLGIESFTEKDFATIEWAQTLFEIYLGDLAASDKERSSVDTEEVQEKWDLLRDTCRRWSYLVGDMIHCRPRDEAGELPEDQLTYRYLWANAVFTGFIHDSRDFVLDCFEDLKATLAVAGQPALELPNSAVMPEISAARAEREISKLKTMDFFTSIFRATTHMSNPVEVIVNLEAVLDPQSSPEYEIEDGDETNIEEMARFLEGSSAQFKQYLWDRLREAYEHEEIAFPPKVLTCRLKCIDLIVSEFNSPSYVDHSEDHRQFVLLRAIRSLEITITETLNLALSDRENLSLDNGILLNSLQSLFCILRLLHTYAYYEDGVMNSEYPSSDLHSYRLVVAKLRTMLVKTWCLTYLIYREIIENDKGELHLTNEPQVLLGNLLRDIHDELGLRNYCKLPNRDFLKLMQSEYLRFDNREFDEELAQCIQCRYHLFLGPDDWKQDDHKTEAENFTKKTALEILDFVLLMASKKKIQQLPKADIKLALDKMVEMIGLPKKSVKIGYNEGVLEQYLAGSIHPLKLISSLKGLGSISTAPITGDQATAAAKGLYFLMGHIHLSMIRDRSVKNRAQVKGDDLEDALRYFKYTLMCDPDNWEAWYRLAQTYGQQVDEDMTWTADAMNNHRHELVIKERKCILSFVMAVAASVRDSDDSEETGKKLANMYFEFGYRIYASTTPPMNMETWSMNDFCRHFSGSQGQGMYKEIAHKEVTRAIALRFAIVLIQKALDEDLENWKFHYVLGKCMDKLRIEDENTSRPADVLKRFSLAVKCAPEKAGSELLLEPHHKLMSKACKYVMDDSISPEEAYKYISSSVYSKGTSTPTDQQSFLTVTHATLSKMRSADKQKWHHRMTHRITQLMIKYPSSTKTDAESPSATPPATPAQDPNLVAATKEFSSLFTSKASTLAIWRPENERPGRHFVFASAYTLLYVSLLEKLQDRSTLEAVAKRVRKNAPGLWNHPQVWETTYKAYVSVLRSTGGIEHKLEDKIFLSGGLTWDEFSSRSARLEAYCNSPAAAQLPLFDLFREVAELRRLNLGFGVSSEIDELLADTYAKLYRDLMPEIMRLDGSATVSGTATPVEQLPPPPPPPPPPALVPAPVLVNTSSNPMSLSNLMESRPTTATSTTTTTTPSKPPAAPAPAAATATATATATSAPNPAESDLPLRGKLTKVSHSQIISRASSLFKPAPTKPTAQSQKEQQSQSQSQQQSQQQSAKPSPPASGSGTRDTATTTTSKRNGGGSSSTRNSIGESVTVAGALTRERSSLSGHGGQSMLHHGQQLQIQLLKQASSSSATTTADGNEDEVMGSPEGDEQGDEGDDEAEEGDGDEEREDGDGDDDGEEDEDADDEEEEVEVEGEGMDVD